MRNINEKTYDFVDFVWLILVFLLKIAFFEGLICFLRDLIKLCQRGTHAISYCAYFFR